MYFKCTLEYIISIQAACLDIISPTDKDTSNLTATLDRDRILKNLVELTD